MRHFLAPQEAAEAINLMTQGSCVTIGNFDGVHVGHQTLIRRTLEKGRQHALAPVVVTFWPHPLAVLAGHHAPAQLTTQEERLRLFAGLGVENVLELPFTHELAALSPDEFVRKVLLPLGCRQLVVGYDFSLGRGRMGNFEVLRTLGKSYGFGLEQLAPVIVNDAVVSSTRVRDLVRGGEVWELQSVLGRCHSTCGQVIQGFGRGAGLGFPTANLHPDKALLPRNGVYATWVVKDGEERVHPGVTNIGQVPTFNNGKLSVETFLLDGGEDLYDQRLCLHFVQRIRGEQRFSGPEELGQRIAKDVDLAKGILASAPLPVPPVV